MKLLSVYACMHLLASRCLWLCSCICVRVLPVGVVERESLLPVGRLKRDAASWLKHSNTSSTGSSTRRLDLNNLRGTGSVSQVISMLEEQRRKKAELDVTQYRSGKAWQRKYGNAAENLDFNKAASLACAILRDYERWGARPVSLTPLTRLCVSVEVYWVCPYFSPVFLHE